MALILIDLFDNGLGNGLYALCTAVEVLYDSLEGILCELFTWVVDILLAGEWYFHREHMEELLLAALIVTGVLNNVHHTVPDDVGDIHADALSHEGVTTFLVDYGTLFVHHIVILDEALTDTEVVLLDLLLCTFDALRDHR